MEDRKQNLLLAKEYLHRFIGICKDYHLLDKSELRKVDGERVQENCIIVFIKFLFHIYLLLFARNDH